MDYRSIAILQGVRDAMYEAEKQFRATASTGHADLCLVHREQMEALVTELRAARIWQLEEMRDLMLADALKFRGLKDRPYRAAHTASWTSSPECAELAQLIAELPATVQGDTVIAPNPMLKSDTAALDEIAKFLSGQEWDESFLEDVAEFVRATGRVIADVDEEMEEDEEPEESEA